MDLRGLGFRRKHLLIPLLGLTAFGGAYAWLDHREKERVSSIQLYDIQYQQFMDWDPSKKSPFVLFSFRNEDETLRIQGSVNQVEADFNPTPELHTDGIADYYISTTLKNQPGWTAKVIDDVEANGIRFRMILREGKDRKVVNSFAVKGNTTLIVSLTTGREGKEKLDEVLPKFKEFLSTIEFKPRPLVASR